MRAPRAYHEAGSMPAGPGAEAAAVVVVDLLWQLLGHRMGEGRKELLLGVWKMKMS